MLTFKRALCDPPFEFSQMLAAQMMGEIGGGEGELSVFILHGLPLTLTEAL